MERSVPGIDIAFGENRFFYHTPKDNMDLVVGGEVQHLGDNLLHLVRAMLREDYLANEENNDARSHVLVYFDVLGKAFVSMTGGIYVVVLVLVLVVEIGVLASHKSEIRTLLGATSDYLAGTAIGIAWTAGFALLLHQLNPAVVGAHPWLVMSAIACFTLLGRPIHKHHSLLYSSLVFAHNRPSHPSIHIRSDATHSSRRITSCVDTGHHSYPYYTGSPLRRSLPFPCVGGFSRRGSIRLARSLHAHCRALPRLHRHSDHAYMGCHGACGTWTCTDRR